ncbi:MULTISPECIES: hypothetical protein [Nitrosomonas]|uniref:Uncharacterized protein n=1 Tax=Nitrosomonas communis TaxID=44574 RepID=A0A1H2U4H7_9PROT|nr:MULTISPECIES: hypothetical protein [Nitrosomonas]TYP83733.1 hypothetical protein BCL69_10427 [Nitrosomonas communis]UVS60712.1 hypothetical protein NX761_14585 [Nitrosomonas sp. PLL12]SDW50364.1 hypothetical protein SAMN05421882_10147 [Nitrosomonas communis]
MNTLFLFLLCLPTLFAAVWAHHRISTHSSSTRWITRGFLIVLGLAFGWAMAFVYTESQGLEQALIFISSFGMAHVPAAFVLQLKHWRGGESDKD